MTTSRSSSVQPGTTSGVAAPSPAEGQQHVALALLDLPLRDPVPRHVLAGRPGRRISIPSSESARSKASPPRRRCRVRSETPRIVVVVVAATRVRSAAGPRQLAQRPETDQGRPGLVEGAADPVLLADHAVVVDPRLPVVGRQRPQLGAVDRRVQVELGDARAQRGEVLLEHLRGSRRRARSACGR